MSSFYDGASVTIVPHDMKWADTWDKSPRHFEATVTLGFLDPGRSTPPDITHVHALTELLVQKLLYGEYDIELRTWSDVSRADKAEGKTAQPGKVTRFVLSPPMNVARTWSPQPVLPPTDTPA